MTIFSGPAWRLRLVTVVHVSFSPSVLLILAFQPILLHTIVTEGNLFLKKKVQQSWADYPAHQFAWVFFFCVRSTFAFILSLLPLFIIWHSGTTWFIINRFSRIKSVDYFVRCIIMWLWFRSGIISSVEGIWLDVLLTPWLFVSHNFFATVRKII